MPNQPTDITSLTRALNSTTLTLQQTDKITVGSVFCLVNYTRPPLHWLLPFPVSPIYCDKTDLLGGFAAALDLFAGLDGADDDADGHHQDGEVLGEGVATTEVVHPGQHAGDQTSLETEMVKHLGIGQLDLGWSPIILKTWQHSSVTFLLLYSSMC